MNDTHVATTHPDTTGQLVHIPHSQLFVGKRNVRKVKADRIADQQLIASIRESGIIQNLVVIPDDEHEAGQYEVIAGGRRYHAVAALIKAGELPSDYAVPCRIVDNDKTAATSLAENFHRAAMLRR